MGELGDRDVPLDAAPAELAEDRDVLRGRRTPRGRQRRLDPPDDPRGVPLQQERPAAGVVEPDELGVCGCIPLLVDVYPCEHAVARLDRQGAPRVPLDDAGVGAVELDGAAERQRRGRGRAGGGAEHAGDALEEVAELLDRGELDEAGVLLPAVGLLFIVDVDLGILLGGSTIVESLDSFHR